MYVESVSLASGETPGYTCAAIKSAIKAAHTTQAALAEAIGVDKTELSRMLAGERRMPLDVLLAAADALAVAPTQLLPASPDVPVSNIQALMDDISATAAKWTSALAAVRQQGDHVPPLPISGYRRVREIRVPNFDAFVERMRAEGLIQGQVAAGPPGTPIAIVPDEWEGEWWTRAHPDDEPPDRPMAVRWR